MLNILWVGCVFLSVVCGAFTHSLDAVAKASTDGAQQAASLALSLVGPMALWLGLMHVLEKTGAMAQLGDFLQPVLKKMFPDIPDGHPALGMIALTFSANLLGLANAATPFGLKTMASLNTLNTTKDTLTHSMMLFLAINTSGVVLFPTGIIALRASLGSHTPGSIVITTWITSCVCMCVAIVCAKTCAYLFRIPEDNVLFPQEESTPPAGVASQKKQGSKPIVIVLGCVLGVSFIYATAHQARIEGWHEALHTALSHWTLVVLMCGIMMVGLWQHIPLYDTVVEGGKEAFHTTLRILPYMVAMLVGIAMFKASGGLDMWVGWMAPWVAPLGFPAEALPMALIRPLSGSGAYAVAAETMRTYGPDSLTGLVVSTLQGNETTFYVLALYTGSVGISKLRYVLLPCLLSDVLCVFVAGWVCRYFLN